MNVAEPDHHKLLSDAFTTIKQLRQRVEELESAKSEPIAVVGMGCRFAPDIDSPEAFWELLARGGNGVTEIPRDRWDNDFYYDPNTDAPGKICTRHGGFLRHKDLFDPQFFKISPREASYMDPQQRLLLEVAWEALENANIPPDQLYGSDGGVFVGISSFDYANLVSQFLPYEEIGPTVATGIGLSPASGRISYVLGLQGPSICLDTACSSALVAVHTACESLRKQECSIALAGGVNMILSPLCHVVFSKSHMLSRDGLCKTFDESADGFARSEGAGLLVLKRLKDAVADQNRVLALIRGGAVNQDGASGGLSVPNGPAQQKVIRKALRNAGLKAEDVDYVEAHGTGTPLGDPIEMNALGMVFRESHTASRPLWVGSAKTNLGHMESAAGVGGLIKTILQLQKGVIAPHLNFKQPSSRIAWGQLPVQVPTTAVPWPSQEGRKRIAGVSSFGFSGTNAHLLLEAAPEPKPRPQPFERGRHVMVLSAKNESSLRELALSYRSVLECQPQWSFADICHSASAGRTHFTHRAAIVATSASELKEKLGLLHGGESAERVLHGCVADDEVAKVAFLFTGQGSQYYAMGRELYHSQPLFRDALHQCDKMFSQTTGWSLLDLLYSSTDRSQIHQTAYSQPLLFSIEYALARLWQSWGIQPAVVMGHGMGEYAAAVVAGVFSREDGLKLIAARGKLMQALPRNGGMIAIQGKLEKVAAIAAACGSSISIAAIHGPHSIVISGPQAELLNAAAACQREHLSFTELEVSHAFHSPLMSSLLADFARVAEEVVYSSPRIDFVSNVTGNLAAEALANPEYWVRHISAPVLFYDGMQQLSQRGCKIILEIGPKPTLIDLGRNCVEQDLEWLASLRPGCSDWEQMLQSLARMYVTGSTINWEQVNHGYYRDQVPLPTYRFQRERYWFAPHVAQNKPATPTGDFHPLLGRRLSIGETTAKQVIFESFLGKSLAYLMDHRVLGRPLLPAAAYIEAAMAAGQAVLGGPPVLRNFVLQRPLLLSESGGKKLRTVIEPGPAEGYTFKILSKGEEDDTEFSADWMLHAQGVLVRDSGEPASASSVDLLRDGDSQDVDAYYENMRQRGLEYGAAFRTIRELRTQGPASIGLIALPHELDPLAERYTLHPTVLDGAFQVVGTALTGTGEGGIYLPLGFESLRLLKKTSSHQWACVVRRAPDEGGARAVVADVIVYDTDGTPAVIVSGFRIVPTTAAALKQSLEGDPAEFLYQFSWTRRSQLQEPGRQIGPPGFLIFADRGGVAERIALKLQETGCQSALVYAEEQQSTRTDEGTACTINPSCPSDFVQVLGDAKENSHRATLYFWGLDVPASEEDREISFEANHLLGCGPLLNLVGAMSSRATPGSPSLFVFTRNAFATDTKSGVNAAEAALTGLVRQIAIEHPSLRCTQVDVDGNGVAEIETRQIVSEVLSADGEEQVAIRSGLRFSPRLTAVKNPRSGAMAGPVQVTVNGYGSFENLGLETLKRRPPRQGEVEVAVRAAAINFKDVLHVLGMLKEHALQKGLEWVDRRTLGFECSGTIVAVGDGVSDKKIGDAVICLGSDCLSSYVTVASAGVFLKPKNATFEEAAALATAFLTAHHVLSTQANVGPGDRVLVHAGAGSVGQAAIQLCRKAGAEVFATASPAKWDFLKSQGIKHVMNSRNTEFANQIRELTHGRGVDVVLNSLSGEFIPSSLETLASGGRFLEIGKLDIWTPDQVAQSRPDVSYFTVDLGETTQDVLDGFNAALNQVIAWIDQGSIQALPVEIFQVAEVGAAFRHLAQGRNVGKVVLSFPALEAADGKKAPVSADGCYWISGGLGDIGLKVAEWLVEQGARHLVLSGTEQPAADASAVITRLQTQGARVEAVTADISRRDEALRVLEGIDRSAVCLGGIIHTAGVVKDGMFADQDWNRFRGVTASEIAGVWNLHTLTRERHLDFFVCFSSLAGVLGSKGKGEYAAASTFIDALMQHRKSSGLPGVALDWGPWVLRNKKVQDRMAGEGVQPIPVSRALSILEYALRFDQPQVVAAAIDWREFAERYRARSAPKLLEAFVLASTAWEAEAVHGDEADNILSKLKNAPFRERQEIVLSKVRKTLAETLRLRSAESVRVNQPLADLGIDSLMAVEVRNLLSAAFGRELSSTVVFDHPTANALTAHLIQTIFPGESTTATPVEQPLATAGLNPGPNHSITKTKGEASLQVLVPVWNPVYVDASKRVAVSESAKILLLGDDQAHLDWVRKCYPKSELLPLDLTSNLDAFAKAFTGGSFDQLLWIAPDVSLNCNREVAHELIIEQQEQGVLAVFRIIKAFLALGYADRKLHWSIITGKTQQVTAAESIEPRHSGVLGLVGSLAKEHPSWGLRLLDLDSLASVSAQECLSLPWDKRGEGLAYRRGEWFQQGLARITTPPAESPVYRQSGVYIVIGGAGGLGEVWSRFMIENYRANIIWIGRRECNAEIQSKIDALAQLGSAPLYIAVDATNVGALEEARETVLRRYPAIHGVVHSAIVLKDQSIARMEDAVFRASFSAKLDISVNMDKVFGEQELDFMLFFSSLSSFVRSAGQANYSAGCTFKDSFAHKLEQERPYPVRVVNWGYWGSVGIVADAFHGKNMAQRGIGSIEPHEGMASLNMLVNSNVPQMGVIKAINRQKIAELNLLETVTYYSEIAPAVTPRVHQALAQKTRVHSAGDPELLTPEILELVTELLAANLKSLGLFSNGRHRVADLSLDKLPAQYFERWLTSTIYHLQEQKVLGNGLVFIREIRALADLWAEWETRKSVWMADPNLKAPITLLEVCLKALPEVLTGKRRATDVIFPDSSMSLVDGIYRDNTIVDYFNAVLGEALVSFIERELQADKSRMIRILEIGAGTGGTTVKLMPLLQKLPIAEYCYTDVSRAFLSYAEKHHQPRFPALSMAVFDASKPIAPQSIAGDYYDVVIAANVLHATRNIRETLRNAKATLKKRGVLLLYEISAWSLFSHLTFGLLEGWWLHEDTAVRLPGSPALAPEKWRQILQEEGFEDISFPAEEAHLSGQQIIVAASDGCVRQRMEWPDQPIKTIAENIRDEDLSSELLALGPLAGFQVKPWSESRVQAR